MAKMQVNEIARHAVSKGSFRIVVTKATGETVTLSTPIEKVNLGTAFRRLGATKPMEQYAFDVAGRRVDRFAEAAALVLKKHQIALVEGATIPTYARRAVEMNAG